MNITKLLDKLSDISIIVDGEAYVSLNRLKRIIKEWEKTT